MTIPIPTPVSLTEFRKKRKPPQNYNKAFLKKMTRLDRLALWITEHVGTMGFFLAIVVWTTLWLSWNTLAPKELEFDPPMGFVLWLFISNLIQLMLMPLIMVGQNLQGQHAEARAQHDLEVNIKSEEEIEVILQHLEYQNTLLMELVTKLGITIENKT